VYELNEFRSCLERVTRILRNCQTRFHATGGAAAIAYGDPRTTQDVDLVIDPIPLNERVTTFIDQLQQDQFLFHADTIREALSAGRSFQAIDTLSTLKLVFYPCELVAGGFDRAVELEILPGLFFPVASRPDLVISKLVWISKGSHKSRRDVRQIVGRATETEMALVREFAEPLKLGALLDEVLAEPDEIDA